MAAAANGREKVAKYLLAHGARVNVQEMDGWTALMKAAVRDNLEMVRLLLANGADRAVTNREGGTAESYATKPEVKAILKVGTRAEATAPSRQATPGRRPTYIVSVPKTWVKVAEGQAGVAYMGATNEGTRMAFELRHHEPSKARSSDAAVLQDWFRTSGRSEKDSISERIGGVPAKGFVSADSSGGKTMTFVFANDRILYEMKFTTYGKHFEKQDVTSQIRKIIEDFRFAGVVDESTQSEIVGKWRMTTIWPHRFGSTSLGYDLARMRRFLRTEREEAIPSDIRAFLIQSPKEETIELLGNGDVIWTSYKNRKERTDRGKWVMLSNERVRVETTRTFEAIDFVLTTIVGKEGKELVLDTGRTLLLFDPAGTLLPFGSVDFEKIQ